MTPFLRALVLTLAVASGCAAAAVDDATHLLNVAHLVGDAHDTYSSMICVVVRTFWGHGADGRNSLVKLLSSLQRQKHTRWEALLVVMDSRPFEDLSHIVRSLNDSRVWVYADWIHSELTPKTPQGHWTKFYHNRLYNLTDEAARACPPDSRWVVFTNGDNMYHEDAFSYLDDSRADVVAWDFYSRYQRPTGEACYRFQAEDGTPPCKVNRMRFCHVDLGAVAYRWPRMMAEDRRFGALDVGGEFTGQDGIMTERIMAAGWRLDHAEGRCYYDQGPSPQGCLRSGGVWDERSAGRPDDFGGHCITQDAAQIALHDATIELVTVRLSSDGNVQGYPGMPEAADGSLELGCIRPRQGSRHMLARVFGPMCLEDIDEPIMSELKGMVADESKQSEHPLNVSARSPVKNKRLAWYKEAYRRPHVPVPKFPDVGPTSKRQRMGRAGVREEERDEL